MELYLDSADLNEIEEAFKLGFIDGLTTTPTFMHRQGVTDLDSLILKLAGMVPVLQVEVLGKTAEDILSEAERQVKMGLDPSKTVFKLPVSLEGLKACRMLVNKGMMVNIHLVYTIQQAYMAMHAGATYVCPLVGRLQDQGHDALALMRECVDTVNYYGYSTKVMFSSVRYAEHIRNAIETGVHTITMPWKVMKALTDNHFTKLGTDQFYEHTRLLTVRIKEALNGVNPIVSSDTSVTDALVKMTEFGFGCVTVIDNSGKAIGVFTDGELRRLLQSQGQAVLAKKLSDLTFREPIAVDGNELLDVASKMFSKYQVDTILVTNDSMPVGMIDIQDLNE